MSACRYARVKDNYIQFGIFQSHQSPTNDYGVCLLFILLVKINAILPAVANFTSFIKLEKQERCRYSFHCN